MATIHTQYLLDTLDTSGDGYWRYLVKDDTLQVSAHLQQLSGASDAAGFLAAIHPDDRDQMAVLWQQYATGSLQQHSVEYRLHHPHSGEIAWVQDRGCLLSTDEAAKPFEVVGIIKNMTAQHQAEAAHQRATQRLDSLLTNVQSGILVEDEHRHILIVNQQFCELFGIPVAAEYLVGTDCSNAAEQVKHLFAQPEQFVQRIDTLLQRREKCMGESLRMKDGRVLLRDFIPIWQQEQYKGHLWNYVDVTRYASNEELEIQQTINFFLSSLYEKETVEETLWDVAGNCIAKLGFVDCVIYLVDEQRQVLLQKAAVGSKKAGEKQEIVAPIEIAIGKGIVGSVAEKGMAEIVHDTTYDSRYIPDDARRLSEIAVPILLDGRVLGIIDSEHPDPHFFTHRHLQILSSIAHLCAIKIDLLQNKQRQQLAIEQQRRFYETILNNIPADIAVFDDTHRYLFVNPRGIKDGNLRQWIVGKRDEDYCLLRNRPMELATNRRQRFNEVKEGRQLMTWEEELQDATGHRSYQLRNMYPVLNDDGEVHMVIGYGLDITDRKLIEQQINKSEQALRNLIRHSLAVILTHDLQGNILSANPACYQLLGRPEGSLEGKPLATLLTSRHGAFVQQYYHDYLHRHHSLKGVCKALTAGGQEVSLLFNNYLLEQDQPVVLCFAIDITTRIQAEAALKDAMRSTEQAARAKELFLANMSHEIRTPMNGILGLASLMAKTTLSAQQEEYLSIIQESARHLLKIVNDVLDLEKIVEGKLELERLPFAAAQKVELAVSFFKYKIEEKGLLLRVKNTVPPDLYLEGDQFRLTQVVNNLMSNALKFTNAGSIVVEASCEPHSPNTMMLRLVVADTGIGISTKDQQRIFDPYVQADSSTARQYGGTGLGLSIVRRLVSLMGGNIQVRSRAGEGSSFEVSIPMPVVAAPVSQAATQAVQGLVHLQGLHILVAEDTAFNQLILQHLLQSWGCTFKVVENGADALAAVQAEYFDIVLMDIQMPVMDGMEATRQIRQLNDERKRSVPIVALTAHALKGDVATYLACGMNDCVTKPYEESWLQQVVARCTGRHLSAVHNGAARAIDASLMADFSKLEQMAKGNVTMMSDLLHVFVEKTPGKMRELREAIEAADVAEARQHFHKLKPSLRMLGSEAMRKLVAALDEQLQQETGIGGQALQCFDALQNGSEQIQKDARLRLLPLQGA